MTSDSTLSLVMLATKESYAPPTTVAKMTWPPPQPEAGPSRLPPPQPEVGPSMQPEMSNLRSCIVMEVDDDIPEWLTKEQGYKPSTSPATVLKRQCHRGLGPPVKIGAFNNIENLENNALTNPAFCQERDWWTESGWKTESQGLPWVSCCLPPERQPFHSHGGQCQCTWKISQE